MSTIESRLVDVTNRLAAATPNGAIPTLIAVSKTFEADVIEPALQSGHRHFGENRVQESQKKWPGLKHKYADITLHLIGPLQSNKAADAVALFDIIHTVDREKIAKALAAEMRKQGRRLDVFVQINTGSEPQKAGVLPQDADAFIDRCLSVHMLNVVGLMCIPPFDDDPRPHFDMLRDMAARHGLAGLSMGMSADYEVALERGATHVRVGSAIFGAR